MRLIDLIEHGITSAPVLEVKDQGYWVRKCKTCFSRISSLKVNRVTSNRNQNDQRTILYVSSNTFHQRICFVL